MKKKYKVVAIHIKTGSKYVFAKRIHGVYKVATAKSMETYSYYRVVAKNIKLIK